MDTTLVVTNFSGGKRHGDLRLPGDDELTGLVQLAESVRGETGPVLAIQEMTTSEPGMPTKAEALQRQLAWPARSTYLPRVSTAWYPLAEKWYRGETRSAALNEGLCVVTPEAGLVLTDWAVLNGSGGVSSYQRVWDLPTVEFPPAESSARGDDWLTVGSISFRPTVYKGGRDSDPRAAQVCLLSSGGAPACILVNVHLNTLVRENGGELTSEPQRRVPNAEATFLRSLQLKVIARSVRELRAAYGLPIIVAGDFNAEPDSPELSEFASDVGSSPLLRADICWKCGTQQIKRTEIPFYTNGSSKLAVSMTPSGDAVPAFATDAVCSNDACLEPRFTHKTNLGLIDNVFVVPGEATVTAGIPRVDLSWGYSDHAAIIVPLTVDSGERA